MTDRRLLIIENHVCTTRPMDWRPSCAETVVAATAGDAHRIMRGAKPQVAILDLSRVPSCDDVAEYLDLLEGAALLQPSPKVIVLTSPGNHDLEVRAAARGAFDCLPTPIADETLAFVVGRAFRLWELEDEHRRLTGQPVFRSQICTDSRTAEVPNPATREAPLNLKKARGEAERQAITRALYRCNHNISQAARLLGISRPGLYNLFAKHGLAAENRHE